MKTVNKMKKYLMGMCALLLMFTACSGGSNTGASNKVLRVAIEKTFNTLNHHTSVVAAEFDVIGQFMEGLMRYDAKGELAPAGAESYTVSDDKMTYTFKLRKEAKWQNGDPVTANNYEYAWQQLALNQKWGFPYMFDTLKNGPEVIAGTVAASELGVKALDDYTFEVQLTRPFEPLLQMTTQASLWPLHQETFERIGEEEYGTSVETVMGNGAFNLTSYAVGEKVELTKSETYWAADEVELAGVEIMVIPDLNTQSVMFDSGELDIICVQGELIDQYQDNNNTISALKNRHLYMYLSENSQTESKVLANENFRKAIAHAIDKTVIAETLVKDGSKANDALITRGFGQVDGKDFRDVVGTYNDLMFDTVKAQEYLAQAKAELGMDTMEFSFGVQDMAIFRKVFENVKSQVETNLPGVTMNLNVRPNQIYFPELFKFETPAGMGTWSASYGDYHTFTQLFNDGSKYNYGLYHDDEYERLTKEAPFETDPAKQAQMYAEAEQLLIESGTFISVYQMGIKYRVREGVSGLILQNASPVIDFKYIKMK